MALERSARPLTRCLTCARHHRTTTRSISATPWRPQQEPTVTPSADAAPPPPPPPATDAPGAVAPASDDVRINHKEVTNAQRVNKLHKPPVGSRRRRAALSSSANIPFEELPYQCFQEARNVLKEDRAEKVSEIEELKGKLQRLGAQSVPPEREAWKEKRMKSWNEHIEKLKVWADINDPLVKKRFEDGFGDMNKPIYRHLSELKWRNHKRLILMQRIKQMNVVPDVLPAIDPTVSTELAFGRTNVAHGDLVLAATSASAPMIKIQSYEKGTKLVTIAVVTPDVPNVEKDGFDYRCHFLAANVSISPTRPYVNLASLSKKDSVIQGWLPPYSQKGAPYQRLAVFVLEQPSSIPLPGSFVDLAASEVSKATANDRSAPAADQGSGTEERPTAPTDYPPQATETEPSDESEPSKPAEADPPTTAPTDYPPQVAVTPESESDPVETISNEAAETAAESPETSNSPTDTKASKPLSSTSTTPRPVDPTQPLHERLDVAAIKNDPRYTTRANFILRSFVSKYRLRPIGVDLFRTQWDETTAEVMRRRGIVGHDVEFKRKRVDPLPYQRLKAERYR